MQAGHGCLENVSARDSHGTGVCDSNGSCLWGNNKGNFSIIIHFLKSSTKLMSLFYVQVTFQIVHRRFKKRKMKRGEVFLNKRETNLSTLFFCEFALHSIYPVKNQKDILKQKLNTERSRSYKISQCKGGLNITCIFCVLYDRQSFPNAFCCGLELTVELQ